MLPPDVTACRCGSLRIAADRCGGLPRVRVTSVTVVTLLLYDYYRFTILHYCHRTKHQLSISRSLNFDLLDSHLVSTYMYCDVYTKALFCDTLNLKIVTLQCRYKCKNIDMSINGYKLTVIKYIIMISYCNTIIIEYAVAWCWWPLIPLILVLGEAGSLTLISYSWRLETDFFCEEIVSLSISIAQQAARWLNLTKHVKHCGF